MLLVLCVGYRPVFLEDNGDCWVLCRLFDFGNKCLSWHNSPIVWIAIWRSWVLEGKSGMDFLFNVSKQVTTHSFPFEKILIYYYVCIACSRL
jgi:hypothetical protein